MIFQIVQVASFMGFVEALWKRVSAANAGLGARQNKKIRCNGYTI
jgi:hypothetical protein